MGQNRFQDSGLRPKTRTQNYPPNLVAHPDPYATLALHVGLMNTNGNTRLGPSIRNLKTLNPKPLNANLGLFATLHRCFWFPLIPNMDPLPRMRPLQYPCYTCGSYRSYELWASWSSVVQTPPLARSSRSQEPSNRAL